MTWSDILADCQTLLKKIKFRLALDKILYSKCIIAKVYVEYSMLGSEIFLAR